MVEKYINLELSKKILVIGVKRDTPGGMAAVVNSYDQYFERMKYITTWKVGNMFIKSLYALGGIIHLLCRLFFDSKIKIIHIHGAANASFDRKAIFIKLAKKFGKRVILHMHAADFEEYFFNHKKKHDILVTIGLCDKLIVLSKSWKSYFISIGIDEARIEVLNNVVPFSVKYPVTNRRDGVLHLLFMGEIGKRKGIYDLLKVLSDNKLLFEGKLNLRIGGNQEEEIINNYIISNSLSEMVSFEGWIKGEKKLECLNWADIYILPSYNEGLPIGILEAMSYAHPVISTNVGGIPEVIYSHKNGILVEPGNLEQIKSALLFFIEHPEKIKEYGDESFKMVQPYFPSFVFAHLNSIYKSLLND